MTRIAGSGVGVSHGVRPLSACYFLAMMGMGLVLSDMGPVMPMMMSRLGVDVGAMGFVIAIRQLGYLGGSFLAGRAYDTCAANGNRLLAAGLFFLAVFNALVPFVYTLWAMLLVFLLQGVSLGFIDCGCNLLTIRLHGEGAAPWLQALHFWWAVGALCSPLLGAAATDYTPNDPDLSFYITAAFVAVTSIGPLVLPTPLGSEKDKMAAAAKTAVTGRAEWLILALAGFFIFAYPEDNYGAYVLTYSVHQLKFNQAKGQMLTVTFWGSFTFGRLVSIPLATMYVHTCTPTRAQGDCALDLLC